MVPKVKRLVDPKAIKQARKPYSELSGAQTHGAPPHHYWVTQGAGGPDHSYNLIQLTGMEHIEAQAGNIPKDILLEIVAEREGVKPEEIINTIAKIRRGEHAISEL